RVAAGDSSQVNDGERAEVTTDSVGTPNVDVPLEAGASSGGALGTVPAFEPAAARDDAASVNVKDDVRATASAERLEGEVVALGRERHDAGASNGRSEQWLRGSSPRRLRAIDQRLRIALLLQASVVVALVGLWMWGKLEWNRDPLVSQRFRPLELPALTNRAQNAALQFHHDLVTGAFGQARLLVVEEAEKLVEDAEASCTASATCASGERVFTRATLLRASGREARAFVESFAADGRLVADATYDLSHASGRWLVTARVVQ